MTRDPRSTGYDDTTIEQLDLSRLQSPHDFAIVFFAFAAAPFNNLRFKAEFFRFS